MVKSVHYASNASISSPHTLQRVRAAKHQRESRTATDLCRVPPFPQHLFSGSTLGRSEGAGPIVLLVPLLTPQRNGGVPQGIADVRFPQL